MVKLIIIAILLSGCGLKPATDENRKSIEHYARVVCDYELGVEYWANDYDGMVVPRYNRDGTIRQCPILEGYKYD